MRMKDTDRAEQIGRQTNRETCRENLEIGARRAQGTEPLIHLY